MGAQPSQTAPPSPSAHGRPRWLSARRLIQVIGIVVFVGLWVTRLGQSGGSAPTETQPAIEPSGAIQALGHVAFGSQMIECENPESSDSFKAGAPIWWAADLGRDMQPDDKVRIVWLRDDSAIEEDVGPSDADATAPWDCLYATSPARWEMTGAYRLEIWNIEQPSEDPRVSPIAAVLLSAGDLTVE